MKSSPRNDDDLLENEVENRKGLLLDIEMMMFLSYWRQVVASPI
jgi:hypothetical protein